MSTLKADTIQSTGGGAATLTKQSAAKSWSNINAGASPRDSFNVSSVTDVSTGKYQININNDMSSANYAVLTNGARANDCTVTCRQEESVSGQYTIQSFNYAGSAFVDSDSVFTAVQGDLS